MSLGLSVSLKAEDVDGKKELSPRPVRALRHQFSPEQQQQQHRDKNFLQHQESHDSFATEARIVHVEEASSGCLEKSNCYYLKSTIGGGADANAHANTAGNAFSTRLPTDTSDEEGGKEMSNCDTSETVSAAPYSIGRNVDCSDVRGEVFGDRYCCPVDARLSPASAAAANTNVGDGNIREMGDTSPSPCLETSRESAMRRSASGARAQELVAARFAGIRSAAEARAKASGGAGAAMSGDLYDF